MDFNFEGGSMDIEGVPICFKKSNDGRQLFLITSKYVYEILAYPNGCMDMMKRYDFKEINNGEERKNSI